MSKVSQNIARQVAIDNIPKRKSENRTSELRKALGAQIRSKNDSSQSNFSMKSATNTFSKRSRSVLPPIQTVLNESTPNMLALSSPFANKGSLDYYGKGGGTPRLDSFSESRSVYKIDPNFINEEKPKSQLEG